MLGNIFTNGEVLMERKLKNRLVHTCLIVEQELEKLEKEIVFLKKSQEWIKKQIVENGVKNKA